MSAVLRLPQPFRRFAAGLSEVEVDPGSLRQALQSAFEIHWGLERQIVDRDFGVRSFVRLFVDGRDSEELGGLDAPITEGASIAVLPVVAGCVRGVGSAHGRVGAHSPFEV